MFLTPFRGGFGTESKRNETAKKIFSKTEKDREASESGQGACRDPTSPHGVARGAARLPGLWAPWATFALGLSPINSLKSQKKSRDHRKYFSAAASFCLRKIPSGARSGALPEVGFGYAGFLHQYHDLSDDA